MCIRDRIFCSTLFLFSTFYWLILKYQRWWIFPHANFYYRIILLFEVSDLIRFQMIRYFSCFIYTAFDIKKQSFHITVSYTHLRAHETVLDLVCRLLLEKKKKTT